MKNITSYITGINIIVGLIVLNVLLSFYPLLRVDLTGNRAHSLSPASKEIIKSLDDVVRIKVYLTAALPAEIKPISESLKTTLEEFQKLNRNKIKVTYLDPNKDDEAKIEAEKYGILPLQFSSIKSDKFEMSSGYFGLAMLYGPKEEVIPVAGDVSNLEYFLVSNIKKLTRKDSPVIALVDETIVSGKSSIQLLSKYLQQNYNVIDAKIDGDGELPKFAETLIVVDRKTKIDDSGISKIKNWLDQKKGLIVFQDKFAVDQTMVSQKIDGTGLEQILKDNGIEIEEKMVLDKSSVMANFGSQNGTFVVQYPYWVAINTDNIDRSVPVMSGINSVVLPWASPLKIGDGVKPLFTSSDLTIMDESGSDVSPLTKKNLDGGNGGKLVMSALNPETKLAVVGDVDFVKDQFVSIYQQNLVFALNLVDYFSQDQSLMTIRGKGLRTNPLKSVDDNWKMVIKIGNIAFPVLALILTAVCFNYFRRARNQNWLKQ